MTHDELARTRSDVLPTVPPRRAKIPGIWGVLLTILYVAAIVVVRYKADDFDHQSGNIATLVLSLLAFFTPVTWFILFSGYSPQTRYGTLVVLLALAGTGVGTLRIRQVSGELVPKLRFVWEPEADRLLEQPLAQTGEVDLATTTPHDFPGFLGPQRNAHVSGLKLERDWAANPPKRLWQIPLGAGWSSFAVVNGFAVTMEQRGDEELVTCYAVASGQLRWSHGITARHTTVLGGVGPRSTPTIAAGKVYALGATGVLRCLDGATGKQLWAVDLLQTLGLTPEQDLDGIAWGRSNSPLIVDDLVVVPLGGPQDGPWVSLAAYRQDTGELAWKAGERQASYCSPTPATLNNVRQILIVCQDYVAGHKADGGALLWEHPWPGCSSTDASVSQPVAFGDDRVLLSKAYGGGSQLLRVCPAADRWRVEVLWAHKNLLRTKFTNVVLRDRHVYGLSDGILECVDRETGKRLWKAGRYGQGQVLGVDDLLLVQAESGEVVLVEASPSGHNVLGRLNALDGKTWNNPALYDHYLLVRNAEEAACYQLP